MNKASEAGASHHHAWRQITLITLGLVFLIAGVVSGGIFLQDDIPTIEAWLTQQGAWAPVIFMTAFLVCSVIFVPADMFVFIAGALFGLWWGFLYVVVATVIIMLVEFILGRHLARQKVGSFLRQHPKFNAIDQAISQEALKIAFLLRLGPVPMTPLSYMLSVSRISFRNYLATMVGAFPSFFAWVYYGNLAAHLTKLATGLEHHSPTHYASMIAGAVVAVIATVYITHVARRALKEANVL